MPRKFETLRFTGNRAPDRTARTLRKRKGSALAAAALFLLLATCADYAAGSPLPKELSFLAPKTDAAQVDATSVDWDAASPRGQALDDARFRVAVPGGDIGGHYWNFIAHYGETLDQDATLGQAHKDFVAAGWTQVRDFGDSFVAHFARSGTEAWAMVFFTGSGMTRVQGLEIAPQPVKLVLHAPGASAETFAAEAGDVPYLAPYPGATFQSGSQDDRPFLVPVPGTDQPEAVAAGSILKTYALPASVSNTQLAVVYHDALTAAGWQIVREALGSDVAILAHYTGHGRNIWAGLHRDESLAISVADTGDLGAALARNCHAPLYGILFEFDKSTLLPASEAVLQQVLALVQGRPQMHAEIQGHTDNVGGDNYNQKLSESRARAVVEWLRKHGIDASRLSATGYGRKSPVADNGTDEGRARNRRVEIADRDCARKP